MQYTSTHDRGVKVSFTSALLQGLAEDGGLFIPECIPTISTAEWHSLQQANFTEYLALIWQKFADKSISTEYWHHMATAAMQVFPSDNPLPLQRLDGEHWVFDLTTGPSLSFKDIAMQTLGQVLPHLLAGSKSTGAKRQRIILGATSGDTGPAAIAGFNSKSDIAVVILFPRHGTSEFQRRQMTCNHGSNIYPIAVNGSFDDCQQLVKQAFRSPANLEGGKLMAVNSINWGRIISQIAYYCYLAGQFEAPKKQFDVTVPTGNFGNVYAAHLARQMGAPIAKLTIACNSNDALVQLYKHNNLQLGPVKPTISPSMDVQLPSNLERYLAELLDDPRELTRLYSELLQQQQLSLPGNGYQKFGKQFTALSFSDAETLAVITDCWQKHQRLVDPHGAIAIAAGRIAQRRQVAMVSLLTASPLKFSSTMQQALSRPLELPASWQNLMQQTEDYQTIDANALQLEAVLANISS